MGREYGSIYVACYVLKEGALFDMVHNGHLVKILHCCTEQAITEALEKLELTAAQGRVMGYLARNPCPKCPKDVEEAFHLSHPTVSGLLARLEKKGFLELYPDPDDHRCKRIRILPKGMHSHETMHHTIVEMEHRMVSDFTPEEEEAFHTLLTRAIANMGVPSEHPQHKEDQSK